MQPAEDGYDCRLEHAWDAQIQHLDISAPSQQCVEVCCRRDRTLCSSHVDREDPDVAGVRDGDGLQECLQSFGTMQAYFLSDKKAGGFSRSRDDRKESLLTLYSLGMERAYASRHEFEKAAVSLAVRCATTVYFISVGRVSQAEECMAVERYARQV